VASPSFWDDPFRRKRFPHGDGRIAAAAIKQDRGRALTVVDELEAANDVDGGGDYEVEEAETAVLAIKDKQSKKGNGKGGEKKRSREGGDTTTKKHGNKKQKKDKKQKKHRHEEESEDRLPLDPTCQVRDPLTKEKVLAVIAKSRDMLALEPLAVPGSLPAGAAVPHGGKMFEEPSFSSGVLELPPRAVKNYEVMHRHTHTRALCTCTHMDFMQNTHTHIYTHTHTQAYFVR
jgi:hypothetical protein